MYVYIRKSWQNSGQTECTNLPLLCEMTTQFCRIHLVVLWVHQQHPHIWGAVSILFAAFHPPMDLYKSRKKKKMISFSTFLKK